VHTIALKLGKQELAKVSGPHIGGEAKREASVQRGRLVERLEFLDCAMQVGWAGGGWGGLRSNNK
jgi:hypothetical protein